MIPKKLEYIAGEVRKSIIEWRGTQVGVYTTADCCRVASATFSYAASKVGFNVTSVVSEWDEYPFRNSTYAQIVLLKNNNELALSHVWNKYKDIHIDITAEQYGCASPVYVNSAPYMLPYCAMYQPYTHDRLDIVGARKTWNRWNR